MRGTWQSLNNHHAEVNDGVRLTVIEKMLKGSDRVPQEEASATNEPIGVRNVNPKK
jgi:hypothetical protein